MTHGDPCNPHHAYAHRGAVEGAPRGRLHGWRIPVKDLLPVAGLPMSRGNAHLTQRPTTTAPFAQHLLAQGATIAGKTQTSEYGVATYCEPIGFPAVDNPLWPGRTPGGSSGGAAALVAGGHVRVAHASDRGGSIRVPAACCGIYGLKPAGRGGIQGLVAADPDDLAFVLDRSPRRRRLRIGVLTAPVNAETPVADAMIAAVEEAASLLSRTHEVIPVPVPYTPERFAPFRDLFAWYTRDLPVESSLGLWLKEHGLRMSLSDHAAAEAAGEETAGLVRASWDVDVVLSPVLSEDPPAIGHFAAMAPEDDFDAQTRWTPWATVFNMTGTAAMTVPWPVAGRQPVGLHLGAVGGDEADLLAAAADLRGDVVDRPGSGLTCEEPPARR